VLTAPLLSVTVRLNTRDVAAVGAVNVGVAVLAPVRDTGVPDVCTHEYDIILAPFGEKLPVPSNETVEPWVTVWLAPALAIGAVCTGVVEGTQTPFCSIEPVGHVLVFVKGTQTPFCSIAPVGHVPAAVLGFAVENGCCPCESP